MSQLLSLGAINKLTDKYIYPKIANKKDEYICPECNKDLILVKGKIRIPHFRHKVDNINPCHHYSKPTESQIHKDAKMLMKYLLENRINVNFIRECVSCKKMEEFDIPEMTETSNIQIEHRFDFNGPKIADVAYIDNREILCIFEICYKHKTCNENRPEPWFEIDAKTLIKLANDNNSNSLQIPCIRCEKCDDCYEIENANLKEYNIEKYVRIKLGQKIFPTPRRKYCKDEHGFYSSDRECGFCNDCKYNEWYDNKFKIKDDVHLRFNFHAEEDEDIQSNKYIIELFDEDFMNNKFVIHTYKGILIALLISKLDYDKYDYWKFDYNGNDFVSDELPYKVIINECGISTVEVIIKLIKYCQINQKMDIRKFLDCRNI